MRVQRLESIGTLAGGIAHDLNNMLLPILVSAEMLRGLRAICCFGHWPALSPTRRKNQR